MVDEAEKSSTKQVSESRLLELLCRTAEIGTNEGIYSLGGMMCARDRGEWWRKFSTGCDNITVG